MGQVLIVLLGLLAPGACEAQTPPPLDDAVFQGEMRIVDRQGKTAGRFVLERTSVTTEVTGAIAAVEVEQRFHNPAKNRIEAEYVFPLPDNAAVSDMYFRIGDRVVYSKVKEREKARKIYEKAKQEGKTAALLEQERANIFTQSLANIPAGETVFVKIRYVHELKYDDGIYRFVFPMVVGPRFIPGFRLSRQDLGSGWSMDTTAVPDASRITPHVLTPGERNGHDISLRVRIDAGLPIKGLRSKSHLVDIRKRGSGVAEVQIRPSDRIPNKDFVLQYGLSAGRAEPAVLAHRDGKEGYFMLLLQPQAKVRPSEPVPKELVFVVDNSGSMSGEPIAKAKQAMRRLIMGMNPYDSFQIIKFSDAASQFSRGPLPNTFINRRRGLSYVNGMRGMGGTQMLAGIRAALDFPKDPHRRRMVFFMTDGYIGNDAQILAAIKERLGDTRLYSFGVGSSVNRYLLNGMAEAGNGFVQYVRNDENTLEAVDRFYRRISNPLLMDLAIDWGGLDVSDVYPGRLPDLFENQPLFVFGRYGKPGSAKVRLRGSAGQAAYEKVFDVVLPEGRRENKALGALWARKQIKAHMDAMLNIEDPKRVKRIIELAKRFNLMSKYTSFVAVERNILADTKLPLDSVLIPVEMPEGVSHEGVFGPEAQVSIPRMKPGDPVLSVDAPEESAAVIAEFDFGLRKLLKFDPDLGRWTCRFLVPRRVEDGRYPIRVLAVQPDGSRRELNAFYTVDSKAPVLTVSASREGSKLVFTAVPKKDVLEMRSGPRGAIEVLHDVKRLRILAPDGRVIPMKLIRSPGSFTWKGVLDLEGLEPGETRFLVEATDYAGNIHHQVFRHRLPDLR
ncbi:MAG: VIT domain-containing protein [Elusimicrobiota bacterium]